MVLEEINGPALNLFILSKLSPCLQKKVFSSNGDIGQAEGRFSIEGTNKKKGWSVTRPKARAAILSSMGKILWLKCGFDRHSSPEARGLAQLLLFGYTVYTHEVTNGGLGILNCSQHLGHVTSR